MLRATITYTVDPGHLDTLKVGASRYLPEIQPGLRTEILARALGFNSWAAVRASGETRRTLCIPAALAFAKERGLEIQPVDLHYTMAQATLLRIAGMTPLLHSDGYGSEYISPGRDVIAEGISPGTQAYRERCRELIDAEFSRNRSELLSEKHGRGILCAMGVFSSLARTKTVGVRAPSSYTMKHVCERMFYDIGDDIMIPPSYVSNTEAIVAALDQGFPIDCNRYTLNVAIGIGWKSIKKVRAAREDGIAIAA